MEAVRATVDQSTTRFSLGEKLPISKPAIEQLPKSRLEKKLSTEQLSIKQLSPSNFQPLLQPSFSHYPDLQDDHEGDRQTEDDQHQKGVAHPLHLNH